VINEAKARVTKNTSVVIIRSYCKQRILQIQNSTESCLSLNVRLSLVLKNMLTLHLASPVAHHRIPFQNSNYNIFAAHRLNATFIHISISNVLSTGTVQSIHLAVDLVIKSFTASSGARLSHGRVSTAWLHL